MHSSGRAGSIAEIYAFIEVNALFQFMNDDWLAPNHPGLGFYK